MKVRIVKCSSVRWYVDQVGLIVNVVDCPKHSDYYAFSGDINPAYRFLKSDCEILPEENQPEPFDLERALKGEKVVDSQGSIGKYMLTNRNGARLIHLFQFSVNNGYDQAIITFDESVGYWIHGFDGKKFSGSVFMAPRPTEYVTKWVNVYDSGNSTGQGLYSSKEEAERVIINQEYIGSYPVTIKLPS